jgi:hypothetical protein
MPVEPHTLEQPATGAEQSWADTREMLDGASEAATLEYLHHLADLMGYDYGNVRFAAMPDHVGGYTHTDYETRPDGEVVMNGNDIYLNEALLPGDHTPEQEPVASLFRDSIDFYDDAIDGLEDTFYHELIHGHQFRDIRDDATPYMEDDLAALLPLHEGQTSYNADDASYRDMNTFYELFLDTVADGESPGDALYKLADEYRIDVVYMDDDEGGAYDFVVTPRDEDVTDDDIYAAVEDAYGLDVLDELSYEVDYREFDTDKLGEHMIRVQDTVADGYDQVADVYGTDAVPTGYTENVAEQPV